MLVRLNRTFLLWPTVLTLAGVALLAGLGTWQLQRRQWKEALIVKIAERIGAPPLPLAEAEARWGKGEDIEYLHVVALGRFRHDSERYLYSPGAEGLGWQVYTPLDLGAGRLLWVNRGVVPDARKAPATRAEGLQTGEVVVVGLLRPPARPHAFAPRNDVAHNLWYWPDVEALGASLGPDARTLPFTLEIDRRPEPPGGLPRGGVTRVELPNHHLQYALTWYGLALVLISVYFAFAITRLGDHGRAQ